MVAGALLRRHLTASQRAALAVKLDEVRTVRETAARRQIGTRFRRADDPASTVGQDLGRPQPQRTREAVAEIAGVSHETARQALDLKQHAPDLFEQVAKGRKTVHGAANEMRRRRGGGDGRRTKLGGRRTTGHHRPKATPGSVPQAEAGADVWSKVGADGQRAARKWDPERQIAALLREARDVHENQTALRAFPPPIRERLIGQLEEVARLCTATASMVRAKGDRE
jgi:hypothetical protein